jgi:hypothetical protein
MTRIARYSAAVVAALALAACGGDAAEEEFPDVPPPAAETPAPTPDPMAETPAGMSATLNATEGSGISGTAMIEHAGDDVQVRLDVTGLQAGTTYTGHLHRGTCSEDRGEVTSIESFTVTEDRGEATATIARSSLDAAEQQYFVEIHSAEDTVVACGDLPAGALAH